MQFHLTGKDISLHKNLHELVSLFEPCSVWILDEEGKMVAATQSAKKNSPDFSFSKASKHNIQLQFQDSTEIKTLFKSSSGLKYGISGLFSASKIDISGQSFSIIKPVNPATELQISPQSLIESEFGIYTWHFHLDSNLFFFSEDAAFKFLGKRIKNIDYQDFYSSLSIESLDRFSLAMENAINLGKEFELELLIENPSGNNWIKFICKSTRDSENGEWLTGLIKDFTKEQKETKEKQNLNLWMQAGLNPIEVRNAEGETIANFGDKKARRGSCYENGKRTSVIYDFRNQPKFTITFDDQASEQEKINTIEISKPEIKINEPEIGSSQQFVPDTFLNKNEQCIALTKHLGLSLDAKVSALGIFDGSHFEWKAWWKSPNQYAMPVKKFGGEWIPELDWLVDVESENQKYPERYWWPQDMLPFEISKAFGEGWMLIAEPISTRETSVFAILTSAPEQIKKQTNIVLQSLDSLKTNGSKQKNENQVEKLQSELAQKDLLIKEMNHRAKNNLALAASLVKMETGYASDPGALFSLKQTQKRLETLASIHELMYKNTLSNELVDIRVYLTQLIEGLVSSFGNQDITLELKIDSVEIPMKQASTIGLLVNELVSNAFKYAFSSGKKGILKVDFLQKADMLKLRVSDNGPGIQKGDKSEESLGKILIEEFVKQLQGSLEIDNSNGTTFFISFKK
jgi:two-component sensor histidine kinase